MQVQRCKVFLNKKQFQRLQNYVEGRVFSIGCISLNGTFPNGNKLRLLIKGNDDSLTISVSFISDGGFIFHKKELENINLDYKKNSIFQIFGIKPAEVLYLFKIENYCRLESKMVASTDGLVNFLLKRFEAIFLISTIKMSCIK